VNSVLDRGGISGAVDPEAAIRAVPPVAAGTALAGRPVVVHGVSRSARSTSWSKDWESAWASWSREVARSAPTSMWRWTGRMMASTQASPQTWSRMETPWAWRSRWTSGFSLAQGLTSLHCTDRHRSNRRAASRSSGLLDVVELGHPLRTSRRHHSGPSTDLGNRSPGPVGAAVEAGQLVTRGRFRGQWSGSRRGRSSSAV
jgi:hypothetical protein